VVKRLRFAPKQFCIVTFVALVLLFGSFYIGGVRQNTSRQILLPNHPNELSEFRTLASTIDSYELIFNDTLLVTEWIYVENGGELVILNSTVVFVNEGLSIVAEAGGNLTISGSFLYSSPDCDWWISGNSQANLKIEYCRMIGSGTGTGDAIQVRCDRAIVRECQIENFGGNGLHAFECDYVIFENNTISNCDWEGIDFVNTVGLIVSGNRISETGYCGIFGIDSIDANIESNTILSTNSLGIGLANVEDSEVSSNYIQESGLDSISLEYCNQIAVQNNTITQSYGCGILSIRSTHLYLRYNSIWNASWDGINLLDFSENIEITGNLLSEIISCGIASSSTKGLLIAGNWIEDIGIDGLNIHENSENVTILLNTILDCRGIGMYFLGSNEILVAGNWVNNSRLCDVANRWSENGLVFLNAFCSEDIEPGASLGGFFSWDNGTMGNYWADHGGEDADGDLIGDSLYVVDDGDYDFYPLVDLTLFEEFRINHNEWFDISTNVDPTGNETDTTTTSFVSDIFWIDGQMMDVFLTVNATIQIIGVIVILIILRTKYIQ